MFPRSLLANRQHRWRASLRLRLVALGLAPLLIGGILAAQAIMPTTGLFIIVAFWCINKCSKKPLVSMAVGPLGAILVGLIANVLFLLSLYTPAA